MSEKEKEAKKEYSKNRYKEMKKKMHIYCYSIKMSEQTLEFHHFVVYKKYYKIKKNTIKVVFAEIL